MLFTTQASRRRKNLVMQNADQRTVFEVSEENAPALDTSGAAGELALRRQFAADCGSQDGLRVVVDSGNGRLREHTVVGPYVVIGNAPSCNLRLDAPGLGAQQAFLLLFEGRVFACDLASPGGTRNEGRLITKAWLQGRPAIEFCGMTATLADAAVAEAAEPAADRVQLELAFGGDKQAYRVRGEILLIGRDARCKLQCRHESISAVHAAIVCTRTRAWLIDLGSPEGIILDGIAVRIAPLADGNVLTLGDKEVEVRTVSGPGGVVAVAPATAGAVSEGFVLEVLERFQDSQRQLLDEMRTWTKDFSQALISAQHSQSQQLQGERQEMRREFVELMRIMAQRLPGPAATNGQRSGVVQPAHPDQRLPAPPRQLPAPPVAPTADAEERLATTNAPEELRRRLQEVEQHLDAQQGWLGSLLRRSPR